MPYPHHCGHDYYPHHHHYHHPRELQKLTPELLEHIMKNEDEETEKTVYIIDLSNSSTGIVPHPPYKMTEVVYPGGVIDMNVPFTMLCGSGEYYITTYPSDLSNNPITKVILCDSENTKIFITTENTIVYKTNQPTPLTDNFIMMPFAFGYMTIMGSIPTMDNTWIILNSTEGIC